MPGEADLKEALERRDSLMSDLKKGKEMSSLEVVKRTIDVLRRMIAHNKWTSAEDLLDLIRKEGRKIIKADPSEGCIANMVRRVLRMIREDFATIVEESKKEQDLTADDGDSVLRVPVADYSEPCPALKGHVIESIGELLTEIESSVDIIATQALEYIHADETVLTIGHSNTVEAFFKNAARKRKFHVIVCEGEPYFKGHDLVKILSDVDNINVTLIPDTHIYAMMRKVNKVFIGTHSVMAEGGCKGPCGIYNVAQAAKDHKVPVFVCAPTYKLCPDQFMSETQLGFQKWTAPTLFLPMGGERIDSEVDVSTVMFEYVQPELINLFIFNTGPTPPATVYRLVNETYNQEDFDLQVHDQK